MKTAGFTILEVIFAMAMMLILVGAIIFVYLACMNTWTSLQDRADIRTGVSQALEVMSTDLRKATSVPVIVGGRSITFDAVLGQDEESHNYRFHLYKPEGDMYYSLFKGLSSDGDGHGAVFATGIDSSGTDFTIDETTHVVTMDLTARKNGQSVHMRTKVFPRRLP